MVGNKWIRGIVFHHLFKCDGNIARVLGRQTAGKNSTLCICVLNFFLLILHLFVDAKYCVYRTYLFYLSLYVDRKTIHFYVVCGHPSIVSLYCAQFLLFALKMQNNFPSFDNGVPVSVWVCARSFFKRISAFAFPSSPGFFALASAKISVICSYKFFFFLLLCFIFIVAFKRIRKRINRTLAILCKHTRNRMCCVWV